MGVAAACVVEFAFTLAGVVVAAACAVEFVPIADVVFAAGCAVGVVRAVATVLVDVACTVDAPSPVVVQNWTPLISRPVQPSGPTEMTGGELPPLQIWTPLRSIQPGDPLSAATSPTVIVRIARAAVNCMTSGAWEFVRREEAFENAGVKRRANVEVTGSSRSFYATSAPVLYRLGMLMDENRHRLFLA